MNCGYRKCSKFAIGKKTAVGDRPATRRYDKPISWDRLPFATTPLITSQDLDAQKAKVSAFQAEISSSFELENAVPGYLERRRTHCRARRRLGMNSSKMCFFYSVVVRAIHCAIIIQIVLEDLHFFGRNIELLYPLVART